MKVEEFRNIIASREAFEPFVIKTKGGRTYAIKNQTNFLLPDDFESIVIIALRGKGIRALDIESIESVQLEHEPASFN